MKEKFDLVIGRRRLIFDGGMGSMLMSFGLGVGEPPELLCLRKPEAVGQVHRLYSDAGADIIMLDNMNVEDMKKAVKLCRGKAETECSGNVTRENVEKLVDIGVDYISSGALTHSSPILDLSLKNLHAI